MYIFVYTKVDSINLFCNAGGADFKLTYLVHIVIRWNIQDTGRSNRRNWSLIFDMCLRWSKEMVSRHCCLQKVNIIGQLV